MELGMYFFRSPEHRKFLELLFFSDREFSAYDLANLSKMPYATAHEELQKLKAANLVTESQSGRARMFKGSLPENVKAGLQLAFQFNSSVEPKDEEVKAALQDSGAPVMLESQLQTEPSLSLEESLVRGALLAKKDPSVARALPVMVMKNSKNLDWDLLLAYARKHDAKQETGFFLSLTGELAKDKKLKSVAKRFRDHRVKLDHDFFESARESKLEKLLALKNRSEVAKNWNFRMNMSMDSFQSLFEKYSNKAS